MNGMLAKLLSRKQSDPNACLLKNAEATVKRKLSFGIPSKLAQTLFKLSLPLLDMPYNRIQQLDRSRLVNAYQRGEDYIHLATQLGINKKTARNIVTRFVSEGRVDLLRRGGSRGEKMTILMKNHVLELVETKPTVTLREMKASLQAVFPESPSVSVQTLSRFLDGQLYTVKLIRNITPQWNAPDVKAERDNYVNWLTAEAMQDGSYLVYVDECAFNIWTARSFGRAPLGDPAVRVVCASRGSNLTVCLAVSPSNGLCHASFVLGGMTQVRFQDFVSELSALLDGQKCHFIHDNASPHRNVPPMANEEHNLKPLPRYSPFLNIAENAISALKAACKQQLSEPAMQARMHDSAAAHAVGMTQHAFRMTLLQTVITNCLPAITQNKCVAWHNHVFTYVPRVLRYEDIMS